MQLNAFSASFPGQELGAFLEITERLDPDVGCRGRINHEKNGSTFCESNEGLLTEGLKECGEDRTQAYRRCDNDNASRPLGASISDQAYQGDNLHHVHREEMGHTQITTTTHPTDERNAISIAPDATDPVTVILRHITGNNKCRDKA
jgi:hypothetical protein